MYLLKHNEFSRRLRLCYLFWPLELYPKSLVYDFILNIFSSNKSAGKEGIGYQESIYYRMLPLPILITFTLAYNVGMGSLTWVVATEILPFRSRRWTHTVANVTSNLCWFAVTKTYADISRTFGISCPFFVYGSVCLFGFVFIYVFLPETRGKTPEETAKAFR